MSETAGSQQEKIAHLRDEVGVTMSGVDDQLESGEQIHDAINRHRSKIGELIATLGGVIEEIEQLSASFGHLTQDVRTYRDGVQVTKAQSENDSTAAQNIFEGSSNADGLAACAQLHTAHEKATAALDPLSDLPPTLDSIAAGIAGLQTDAETFQTSFDYVVQSYDELGAIVGTSTGELEEVELQETAAIESLEQAGQIL
jgi:ABC-type transporter Mla subunit MlaD